ncbi:HAD family hydrolase [candidate division SR1 bacterium RAAC1_SR1_1]|nr:HAD family hydrolase [candidate division SR1 bacterium RAAC1_SR1_1]
MLQAIIFDMDGVLVIGTGYVWKSFSIVLNKYGIDISQSDRKKYLGKSLADQIKMWKEEYNIQQDIILEDFAKEALTYQLEFMKNELHPDKDVQKLIAEAKEKGIKIAVGTSSHKERAITMLKLVGVFDKIDALATFEDVENAKPAPDIFLKAAELMNIQPENCLVIEDALNGIEAARAAHMKVIGKVGPHHTKEELEIADFVFENFDEITLQNIENLF